jgi:hypothetical protein
MKKGVSRKPAVNAQIEVLYIVLNNLAAALSPPHHPIP